MKPSKELLLVASALAGFPRRTAFVGGNIQSLLITDAGAAGSRPTKDVDVIVDVSTLPDYYELRDELMRRGLQESSDEGTQICKWRIGDVPVDIMPSDPSVFGFGNAWYRDSLDATRVERFGDVDVRFVDAVHAVATKLEAWRSRGGGDVFHHDLEDVLAVVDGRAELLDELRAANADLKLFVAKTIASLLARSGFLDAIDGYLPGDAASQGRATLLLQRLREIAALAEGLSDALEPMDGDQIIIDPTLASGARKTELATPTLAAWIAVNSTNLAAVRYDAAASQLGVRFRSGGVYIYFAVPQTVFHALLSAGSKGSFFSQVIRGRYEYQRVG